MIILKRWRPSLLLALALAALTLLPLARGDPSVTTSGQGSLDIVWNFQNPANYTAADAVVQAGQASLRRTVSWRNWTTQADFANYSSAANVDLASRPGNVLLNDTGVSFNATYISHLTGGGTAVLWRSIGWNSSYVVANLSDDFSAPLLKAQWSWLNPPASYAIGTPRAGYLTFASRANTEFYGAQHSGQVLYQAITGDFDAQTHFDTSALTQAFQKAGLLVMIDPNNWATVHNYFSGGVNLRALTTVSGTSTTNRQVTGSYNYLRLRRTGDLLETFTSPDGITWTFFSNIGPPTLPATLWVGIMVADGLSGSPVTLNVDYIHISVATPAPVVQVETRTGNSTDTLDPSWTPWSPPFADPLGSPIIRRGIYLQFRLLLFTYSRYVRPLARDVNISLASYVPRGEVVTEDFRPGRPMMWDLLALEANLQGGSVGLASSADGGANWTPVLAGPVNLSVAATVRLRLTLSTSDGSVSPLVTLVRIALRVPPAPPLIPSLPWDMVALLALMALAPVPPLLYLRRPEVKDVFLIQKDGILVAHMSRGETLEKDQDNLAGTLTVIQDFVSQSFTYGKGQHLHRLEMGEYQVALEVGPKAYLAVVYSGRGRILISLRMRRVLRAIEAKYGQYLEPWTGKMEDFAGVPEHLEPLLGHRRAEAPVAERGHA